MAVNFADVSNLFSNLSQLGLPKDVTVGLNTIVSSNRSFAEKFSQTLEKVQQIETKLSFSSAISPLEANINNRLESLLEKLEQEKGMGFVSSLKNIFLMLTKGDLKNGLIDTDGLETLKKMLLNAGYPENDINDLIAELSDESAEKDLPLDDVLDRLFDLSFSKELETKIETGPLQETFFETSALPFIESTLNSLGIPLEKVQEILIEADKGDRGISLDVVIDKLQHLQKTSFYTRIDYKTREGDDHFTYVFKQLGLDRAGDDLSAQLQKDTAALYLQSKYLGIEKDGVNSSSVNPERAYPLKMPMGQPGFEQAGSGPSVLTLDELVRSLEQFRKKMLQPQVVTDGSKNTEQKVIAGEQQSDLLDSLYKGVKLEKQTADIKMFEFSSEQIKNQFKNTLLTPDNKNGEPVTDKILKDGLKEMEALMTAKKGGFSGMTGQLEEGKEFLTQPKSKQAMLSDQLQVWSSNVKTNEMPLSSSVLKSKSSFRNLPSYVTHQLSKSIVKAINQGENTLKIQLKPSELGRLVMTIDNTGKNMKVSISTENIAAKEILTSNVNELKTVLSNSGVNLERFDVDMNSDFKQSMANAGDQAKQFNKRNRNREKLSFDLNSGEGNSEAVNSSGLSNQEDSFHFVA